MRTFLDDLFKVFGCVALLLGLTGCPPYSKTDEGTPFIASDERELTLSKSFTGQETLDYLKQLRSSGYTIQYITTSASKIRELNGHTGGGFKIEGFVITIYINQDLDLTDQTHVIAHELSHIKDDFQIDQYLQDRPYIDVAVNKFLTNLKKGLLNLDSKTNSYVLGTVFCSEVKAYTTNKYLSADGLKTLTFDKGDSLASFINEKYILPLGKSYGANSEAMRLWCLKYSSMSEIQSQLGW